MSGIFGCLNLDGSPVDRALLGRMQNRLAHRGPDGAAQWVDGAAGLGHLALHTTPESVRERQPLLDASAALCLTLDGRIDNRDDLLAALRARGFVPRDDTDAELVLQAWCCWGEESPEKILGDFVFAIWDRPARRLFLARDVAGIRQLHYFRSGRTFLWATECRGLFEHPEVSRAPDEATIAQYLSLAFEGNERTIYRDIRRLPPAHSLSVTAGASLPRRYWDVDRLRAIRYRSDDEYGEHLRSIFRESVRCRLRSRTPVAADLSGGLDSSSIVSMVQVLRQEGSASTPACQVFSLAFPGQPCDERPYIESMARRWSVEPEFTEATLHGLDYYRNQAREDLELPLLPNLTMFEASDRRLAARGMRVRLSGIGGDEWFGGSYYALADLLRTGRIADLVRFVRRAGESKHYRLSSRDIVRSALWPLLPHGMRTALRSAFGRQGARPLLGPALERHRLAPELLCREPVLEGCASFDQMELFGFLRGEEHKRGLEESDRFDARHGIETRLPFLDRRLIEFAFALPAEQRWRGGRTKRILRNAMRGLLPEMIEERSGKAEFSPIISRTLCGMQDGIRLENSAAVRLGWVREDEARRIYTSEAAHYNRSEHGYRSSLFLMWWLAGIDIWLKEVVLNQ